MRTLHLSGLARGIRFAWKQDFAFMARTSMSARHRSKLACHGPSRNRAAAAAHARAGFPGPKSFSSSLSTARPAVASAWARGAGTRARHRIPLRRNGHNRANESVTSGGFGPEP